MLSAIILRDIPKQEAQIDLWVLPIKGGFRGFREIPPGVHYVSVMDRGRKVGFWCKTPRHVSIVRVFREGAFHKDEPDSAQQFIQMAQSGAMNQALAPYRMDQFPRWHALTNHIPPTGTLPSVRPQESGEGSRFDQAWSGTHRENKITFLSEFQFAFASWVVDHTYEAGLARWRHLLQATYNAGERRMRALPVLFADLTKAIMAQFDLLPGDTFQPGSVIIEGSAYFIEDMEDSDDEGLMESAKAFKAYMQKRQSGG